MTKKEMHDELYAKCLKEQDLYRDQLSGLMPAAILDHAYEYAMREDIIRELEMLELDAKETEALLSCTDPVAELYKDFSDRGTEHMDLIAATIRSCAARIMNP